MRRSFWARATDRNSCFDQTPPTCTLGTHAPLRALNFYSGEALEVPSAEHRAPPATALLRYGAAEDEWRVIRRGGPCSAPREYYYTLDV